MLNRPPLETLGWGSSINIRRVVSVSWRDWNWNWNVPGRMLTRDIVVVDIVDGDDGSRSRSDMVVVVVSVGDTGLTLVPA